MGEPLIHRRPDRFAVSPVIGTVIMVSITVVTSSMLYFVTTGLLPNPTTSTPTVNLYPAALTSITGQYKLQLSSVSQKFSFASFQVQIINLTTNTKVVTQAVDLTVSSALIQGGGVTLSFIDVNQDGTLSAGDYFFLQGVRPGQGYLVALTWKPSGNVIDGWSVPLP